MRARDLDCAASASSRRDFTSAAAGKFGSKAGVEEPLEAAGGVAVVVAIMELRKLGGTRYICDTKVFREGEGAGRLDFESRYEVGGWWWF